MFKRVQYPSKTLDTIVNRIDGVADFYSIFFELSELTPLYPNFHSDNRNHESVLLEMLTSPFLQLEAPDFLPIDRTRATKFSILDRHEFEGSLVTAFLQGTCTERIAQNESDARKLAYDLMHEAPFTKSDSFFAFRMDDDNWSERTRRATLSWSYFVFVPGKPTWCLLSMADDY